MIERIYMCIRSTAKGEGVHGAVKLGAELEKAAYTQGPSWGYFKSQFLTGLSSFDDSSPQNGSKTVTKSQNRPLGNPHIGPFVVARQRCRPRP